MNECAHPARPPPASETQEGRGEKERPTHLPVRRPQVRRKRAEGRGKTGEDLYSLLAFELAIASYTPFVAKFAPHSYLIASTGSSPAARFAGQRVNARQSNNASAEMRMKSSAFIVTGKALMK